MFSILFFGTIGGIARGLVGYSKYYTSYKNVKFEWKYFGMTVGVSAVVGLLVVWAFMGANLTFMNGVEMNPALAAIAGYAGGDAIENIYKIILKKPVFKPSKSKK